MGRTIEEVLVTGRSLQEVKAEVFLWMKEWGISKVEERDDFVRGRMGIPGGLGLTAPKYFEVTYKPQEKGVLVHTEGWIECMGLVNQAFRQLHFLVEYQEEKGGKL